MKPNDRPSYDKKAIIMIDGRYTGGEYGVWSTVKRVGNPLFIRDVALYLSGIVWYIRKVYMRLEGLFETLRP